MENPHRSFVFPSCIVHFEGSRMKSMYFLTLVLVLQCSSIIFADRDYMNAFDHVDVNAILLSDRLLKQYIACILDKGPCTADGRTFKRMLPDVLATNCAKCNDKQKKNTRKIAKHIKNERPKEWSMFVKKYDANGQYRDSFERFLQEE